MSTCCEEQEARAAELRNIRREATELQESRLLFRGLERDNILRGSALCEPCEPAPDDDGEQSDGEDDFAALRAKRMNALRDKASKASERKAKGYGAYSALAEDPDFAQLRGRHLSIVHLAKRDDEPSDAVDDYLSRVAPEYARFKLYRTEEHAALLDFVGSGRPPLRLLALKAGALLTALELTADDRDDVIEAVVGWLHSLRDNFAPGAESDDDEATSASFCGKAGCHRTFAHEHVEWKRKAADGSSEAGSDSEFESSD